MFCEVDDDLGFVVIFFVEGKFMWFDI